jgi:hypothetical protein
MDDSQIIESSESFLQSVKDGIFALRNMNLAERLVIFQNKEDILNRICLIKLMIEKVHENDDNDNDNDESDEIDNGTIGSLSTLERECVTPPPRKRSDETPPAPCAKRVKILDN